jgi:hypothetical protein
MVPFPVSPRFLMSENFVGSTGKSMADGPGPGDWAPRPRRVELSPAPWALARPQGVGFLN